MEEQDEDEEADRSDHDHDDDPTEPEPEGAEPEAEACLETTVEAETPTTVAEWAKESLAFMAAKAGRVFKEDDDDIPKPDAPIDRAAAMTASQESSRNLAAAAAFRSAP